MLNLVPQTGIVLSSLLLSNVLIYTYMAAAVAQSVRAFAPQVEGLVFEYQPRQTYIQSVVVKIGSQARSCLYASMRVRTHHPLSPPKKNRERERSIICVSNYFVSYCSGSVFINHVHETQFEIVYQNMLINSAQVCGSEKLSETK